MLQGDISEKAIGRVEQILDMIGTVTAQHIASDAQHRTRTPNQSRHSAPHENPQSSEPTDKTPFVERQIEGARILGVLGTDSMTQTEARTAWAQAKFTLQNKVTFILHVHTYPHTNMHIYTYV